jgi:hypothetical protein
MTAGNFLHLLSEPLTRDTSVTGNPATLTICGLRKRADWDKR